MPLTTVTITGADDAVGPEDLAALSREFPFVEWGILMSRKRAGTPRYPTASWLSETGWIERLVREYHQVPEMKLSAHFCGANAREILDSDGPALAWLDLYGAFGRVQINGFRLVTGAILDTVENYNQFKWIFQVHDRVTVAGACYIAGTCFENAGRIQMLWDASGGSGRAETTWPLEPMPIPIGFAGGISPTTVLGVLESLRDVPGDFWIDMETGVRTEDRFDLDKVRTVLELTAPLITSPGASP